MAAVERLSGPFARALAAGRDRYNQAIEQARRARPSLDLDAFRTHLQQRVAPLIDAAVVPEAAAAMADAWIALSLDLATLDWLGPGSRSPHADLVWSRLLPSIPDLA